MGSESSKCKVLFWNTLIYVLVSMETVEGMFVSLLESDVPSTVGLPWQQNRNTFYFWPRFNFFLHF